MPGLQFIKILGNVIFMAEQYKLPVATATSNGGDKGWTEAYYTSEWVVRLVMLIYVPQRRSPAAARTWLLLIFFLPWVGLILYALIGRISLPRKTSASIACAGVCGARTTIASRSVIASSAISERSLPSA